MKLKLLFFPLALAFSIILAIWYIKPEFVSMEENKLNLQTRNQRKNDLEKKMANITSLSNDLGENSNYKKIVMQYIPKEAFVELGIDNANYLAGDAVGVSLVNMSLSKGTDTIQPVNNDANLEKAAKGHGLGGGDSSEKTSQVAETQFNDFVLTITVVGEYKNIKDYLKQIGKMKRLNEIKSISLSKVAESDNNLSGGDETGAVAETSASEEKNNLVQAEIVVSFKYLPFSPIYGYYVLENEKFDYTAISRLEDNFQGGIDIPEIIIGDIGKNNPFE